MPTVRLDKRMSAIVAFVRDGLTVCDVGTDHALIPCYLSQKGKNRIIACDVNEKPLGFARENFAYYGVSDVELLLSDGLESIEFADDIIIAGMGGEQIAEIANNCKFKTPSTRFILQPMTKHEELRHSLYKNGFEIIEEKAVAEGGHIFLIVYARFTGDCLDVDDSFAFIGKITDRPYITAQLKKLRKMGKGEEKYSLLADRIEESYDNR